MNFPNPVLWFLDNGKWAAVFFNLPKCLKKQNNVRSTKEGSDPQKKRKAADVENNESHSRPTDSRNPVEMAEGISNGN